MIAISCVGLMGILAGCGSSAPQLTFDGTGCQWDGSTALSAGPADLTFRNQSDEYAAMAVLELPAEGSARDRELALVGSDFAIPSGQDPDAAQLVGTLLADPGQELTQPVPLVAGDFVVDCATMSAGGQPIHAWRAASLEVKP
jgi:hypothetical protein